MYMENQNIVALICKTILYIISILVWANVIKLAAKEEAAEDHRILKEKGPQGRPGQSTEGKTNVKHRLPPHTAANACKRAFCRAL